QAGAAPASAIAGELGALGAQVHRERLAKRVQIGPKSASAEGYREVWTLPAAPAVQARFTHEGLDSKVIKVFRKEIQTGDKQFDDAVYIRTSTPEATTAFLARSEIRGVLGPLVARGGHLEVQGNVVTGEALWADDEPGPRHNDLIARIVQVLLT